MKLLCGKRIISFLTIVIASLLVLLLNGCSKEVSVGRFPEIEEDEAPYRLLCNEYPVAE